MKLRTQILLAFLIIGKLVLISIFMFQTGINPLFMEKNAIASEPQKDPENPAKESENTAKKEEIDLNFLIAKKSELKEEEERLVKRRAELIAIQEKINKKIETLAQLRDDIRAEVARKKTLEEQKLKHLIKVYSAMKPQDAASLIEKLDIKLAIELLSKMKGEDVGNIMSFVNIEKAAKISEGLVKRD